MSADQGSMKGQIEFAGSLIRGDDTPKDVRESEMLLDSILPKIVYSGFKVSSICSSSSRFSMGIPF
jgi:hypothetical protein